MKLSGRMTRSTDECEMSRSCQSATFSSAAIALRAQQPRQPDDLLAADRIALVRHRRRALLALAERLFDLANLGLLQPADLERELLERRGGDAPAPSAARRADRAGSPATRSAPARGRAAGRRPLRSPDRGARTCRPRRRSCRRGSPSRARSTRSTARVSSAYHSASFRPKVIGSAWTPCVRPIIGVRWCSNARALTACCSASRSARIRSHASRIWMRLRGVDDVGRGEAEVQPARRRSDAARRRRS